MISDDTRSFMALHLMAQHFGRPHTPTDQAWIESLIGHLKTENPYLTRLTDPDALAHELDDRRNFYNEVRLSLGVQPAWGMSPHPRNTTAAAWPSAPPGSKDSPVPAKHG